VKGVQRYKQDENPPNFFTLFVVKFLVGTLGTGWDGLGIGGTKQGIDREGMGIGRERDLRNYMIADRRGRSRG